MTPVVARKLGETRMVIVGAPAYLRAAGTPKRPRDLERHNRIGFGYARAVEGWPFLERGKRFNVPVSGNAQVSDGDALRQLVISGLGLARLAAFQVKDDIAAGRLVPVLEANNPGDLEAVHAVFVGQSARLPARVRVFLDFLVEKVVIDGN